MDDDREWTVGSLRAALAQYPDNYTVGLAGCGCCAEGKAGTRLSNTAPAHVIIDRSEALADWRLE